MITGGSSRGPIWGYLGLFLGSKWGPKHPEIRWIGTYRHPYRMEGNAHMMHTDAVQHRNMAGMWLWGVPHGPYFGGIWGCWRGGVYYMSIT